MEGKFNVNYHIYNKINKCNKTIGVMERLSLSIFRNISPTIYNFFFQATARLLCHYIKLPYYCSFKEKVGLFLESKFNVNYHIYNKINKCNKTIGVMERLSLSIFRNISPTIYNFFFQATARLLCHYIKLLYYCSFKEKVEKV